MGAAHREAFPALANCWPQVGRHGAQVEMELLVGAQPGELDMSLQAMGGTAPLPPTVIFR
eukprot:5563283-Alexandrium_andersonii.AAC.1